MAQRQSAMRGAPNGRAHNDELKQAESAAPYRAEVVESAEAAGDVTGEIERYVGCVERLGVSVTRLEGRLALVCRPALATVDALLNVESKLVPMAETLSHTTGRLEALMFRLDELEASISL